MAPGVDLPDFDASCGTIRSVFKPENFLGERPGPPLPGEGEKKIFTGDPGRPVRQRPVLSGKG